MMQTSTMKVLPEFPGFAVRYSPSAKPFFQSQVIEDLRKINSVPLGKELLSSIAKASPKIRAAASHIKDEWKSIPYPKGINVVIIPTDMEYTQSGLKMASTGVGTIKSLFPSNAARHNIDHCPFHKAGGSLACALDPQASDNGQGCISLMCYTNAQMITSKGESAYSFIVLAHELIHCLNHLSGKKLAGTEEEIRTTGIGKYSGERMSENAFRAAFGIKPRIDYF